MLQTPEGAWLLWPLPPFVNQKIISMQLHHLVQAAVSVICNLKVVCYSGAAIALLIILWRLQLIHAAVSVIW